MKVFSQPILLALLFMLLGRPLFAEYNPLTDTPLQILDQLPGTASTQPQKANSPSTSAASSSSDDSSETIHFDPERGIIIPEETTTSTKPPLNPKAHQEDYLLMRLEEEKKTAPMGNSAVDLDKTYIDRQIEEMFGRVKDYIIEIGLSYKKMFQYFWKYIKVFVDAFFDVSFIADPPPMIVTIPLAAALYGLVCYPLRKIAHTITNEEWMAWVFPMQFVLLLKITERSRWCAILFLIPFVNLIFLAVIFTEICEMFKQPSYYGLLVLIPGLNVALLWYLAYIEFD